MSCLHESNENDTNIVRQSEDKEYLEATDTGDEPLRRSGSQPIQSGTGFTSHKHDTPDEEPENAHRWHLRKEDQTAQHSAAYAEYLGHIKHLHRKDQTARRSAAAINISKMDFSHWMPRGVSERMWSVNLDASISGEYQTPGGHSSRPSE
jgi:hypothetical protein